jgi:hypothetical protein
MCLARALVGLGRLVEARDFLVEAARFPTKTDEPAVFTGARQAAQGEADQLAKRIPTVTLIVSGPDATAPLHVTVDGAVVAPETVRLARKLDPGRHTIIVAASGFAPTTTTVELSEGTDRSVQVSLSPGAPREAVNVAAAPQSTQPQTGAANGSKGVPVLALAVGGVGVAGIVVGAATALAATSTHSKLQGECTGSMCPSSAQGDLDAFHTQRTISGVGYVVGALGIVGGATIWFVTPSRPSESSARLWIGPTSASLRGTF